MKKRKILGIISVIISLLIVCCACGATSDRQNVGDDYNTYSELKNEANEEAPLSLEVGDTKGSQSEVESPRKLIKTVDLSAETKEFDTFINTISKEIEKAGGYVESSDIRGNSYDSTANRSAEFIIRIPADKLDSFSNAVSDICNVTSSTESVSDVTMDYVDFESRLAAYEAEHKTLLELLSKADSIESIISIQSRITDVVYEIESCKSQLRTYDNLVSYSTLNISIREVDRETTVTTEKEGIWTRIRNDLTDNLYAIGNWFEEALVYLIGNLPYLVIWAIIIVSIVIFVKLMVKRRRKRRLAKRQAEKEKAE